MGRLSTTECTYLPTSVLYNGFLVDAIGDSGAKKSAFWCRPVSPFWALLYNILELEGIIKFTKVLDSKDGRQ